MLRASSHGLAADYVDAKPPTPTHDGQTGGEEICPPSLSKCPAGAAETQSQSQPIKHNVDTMCDLCRARLWCDFDPQGLRICLHCREAGDTNKCAVVDDDVYVAAMSTALLRPLDDTTPSEDGAITAFLEVAQATGNTTMARSLPMQAATS